MQPSSALLATWLVPGSAHFVLGRPGRGALALAITVGLFFAGYAIVGTHLWHHLLFAGGDGLLGSLFGIVPLQLLPESFNLGCTVIAGFLRDAGPEALRIERVPVDGAHLGLMLTAVSGVLNIFWMADAHWLAQKRTPISGVSPALAAGASWLLPGAGHVMAGQKSKGIVLGGAVLLMFVAGLAFGEGHSVDRHLASAWFDGQVLCGVGVVFASVVTAPLRFDALPLLHDLGVTLCTVAGFMNLLVICNAYTVAEDGPDSVVVDPASLANAEEATKA